ncbi:hypothetical protein BKA69DRAFT_329053 [Paraphysoderma sedebokerense]|nr:hypothetical protein BKA69DRAFT_329053 [Paraphysoderma sedebokerense]
MSDINLPRKENDTVKDAADLDNDEIQCTVALCLAYLVRFTKDEKIVKRIVDLLIEGWKSLGRDWYNFGAGFALCVIYYHKHSSRSTAVPTYIVKLSHAIHSAFTTTKQTLQPKSYLAIAVGLAYSFSFSTSTDTSEYQQTITNAYSNLETFTETSIFESKKGIIVSASAWIVAADAGNDMKSESEISYSIEVLRKNHINGLSMST